MAEYNFGERIARTEEKTERNERDISSILNEIRALPGQIKSAIKDEFSAHKIVHRQIDKNNCDRVDQINDVIARLEVVETVVIKVKANWKILAACLSAVVAGLVWVIQRGFEALFFK